MIPILFACFFLWFFRDPTREIPSLPGQIVSPADGLVTEAEWIELPSGSRLRLSIFLKDVRSEMRKVIAPTREEVQSTTLIVLITVFIFAAYFWAVDAVANQLIERGIATLTRH